MPEFNLNIEGIRGEALARYAALADKTPESLVLEWIKDKLDHVAIQALRAEGKRWEDIAEELGNSVTQARRIYAQGIDMPVISKETIRILERYVDLIERVNDISLPVPTENDFIALERYCEALPDPDVDWLPVPTEKDIDMINNYCEALPDPKEIDFPVPTEEEIEAIEEYKKAVGAT